MLLGEGFEGLRQRVETCSPPKTALPLFGFFSLERERTEDRGEREKAEVLTMPAMAAICRMLLARVYVLGFVGHCREDRSGLDWKKKKRKTTMTMRRSQKNVFI